MTALQAFAWTGLAVGFVSLDLIQRLVARAGRTLSWVFAAGAIAASAVGSDLGRFRRWNSWDIVRDPLALLYDIAGTVLHPFANAHVVVYCAVLGAFLFTAYVVVHTLTAVGDEPLRRHSTAR